MEERTQNLKSHTLNVSNRQVVTITGVNDVLSFDAGEVLLDTNDGVLMIRGSELHVSRLTLDRGEVDIDGKVDSLTYSEGKGLKKSGESVLGRLFK